VRIDDRTPGWIRVPGFRGEDGFVHAPDPVNAVAFDSGPIGPAFHEVWRAPVRTVAGHPAG
jgi:hypothetical protein